MDNAIHFKYIKTPKRPFLMLYKMHSHLFFLYNETLVFTTYIIIRYQILICKRDMTRKQELF